MSQTASADGQPTGLVGNTEAELGGVGETIRRAPPLTELPVLPAISLGDASAAHAPDLVALSELGRGGMGVVRLAEQRSLGREVAIKTSHSKDPSTARALVREARIMGALEHPNLVPVHSLGADQEGTPVLVMKRVEGSSWRELLKNPAHPGWSALLAGHGDPLRANIEILLQVCRALAFAHDRGVIHRDLKPDNVMIGRFGEVYVLDWGIALKVSERDREPRIVVGTPGYLAPEMARAEPAVMDARTDVYLLGATLYELLAGHPPHTARTAMEALVAAASGVVPPLPASAPADLVALVRASMAPQLDARPATAEAFREELARFLIGREAQVIAVDASAALARAEASIATDGPASSDGFRGLVEARFGFVAALRLRPGDEAIRAQLQQALSRLVERELAVRSPTAARALLAELTPPPPALTARVEALEQQVRDERAAAEELSRSRREADSSATVRPLTVLLGVVLATGGSIGVWQAWQAAQTGTGFPPMQAVVSDLLLAGIFLSAGAVWRKQLLATPGGARVTFAYAIWGASLVGSDLLSLALGHDTNQAAAHSMQASLFVALLISVTTLRELWPVVPTHAVAIAAILAAPRYAPVWVLLGLACDVIIFARAFRQHGARTRLQR